VFIINILIIFNSMSTDLVSQHESMNAFGPMTEMHHHILNVPLSPELDHEASLNINSLHPEHGPANKLELIRVRPRVASTEESTTNDGNIEEVDHGQQASCSAANEFKDKHGACCNGVEADDHGECCAMDKRKDDLCPHSHKSQDVCLFLFMMMMIGQLMK
jgi:hypothetical protein